MKKKGSEEKLEEILVDFTETLTSGADRTLEVSSEELNSLSEGSDEALSLLKTAKTMSAVIQPKQPSEEFINKVSRITQERYQEKISTEKIQRIIGMAVTMEGFRKSLFQDVVAACRGVGFSLTPKEIAALRNLKEDAVKEFANSLDERVTKFFPANLS